MQLNHTVRNLYPLSGAMGKDKLTWLMMVSKVKYTSVTQLESSGPIPIPPFYFKEDAWSISPPRKVWAAGWLQLTRNGALEHRTHNIGFTIWLRGLRKRHGFPQDVHTCTEHFLGITSMQVEQHQDGIGMAVDNFGRIVEVNWQWNY